MRRENFLKLDAGTATSIAGTVLGWNRLGLRAIRAAQLGPAPAMHALALLHTCMYNAWAAYDDAARQTPHGVAVRLPSAERCAASKAAAMSHAAHAILADRFPAQRAVADAWLAGLGLEMAAGGTAHGGGAFGPAGIGRAQASAMRAFCRRAGAARAGGLVGGAGVALPPALPPLAEPAPGRWFLPAHLLSEHDGHDDDQDVRLFFVLANALADAAALAVHGSAGAAAAETMRRFAGDSRFTAATSPAREFGRKLGARAFDGARRHWEGKL